MKKTLYGGEVSPRCSYCEHGNSIGTEILCKKMGVMQPDSCCKKFRYDPLKRVPRTAVIQKDFSPEDFKL